MTDNLFVHLKHVNLRRLIIEAPGVLGCCWFSRRREDTFHVHANILRISSIILFAPLIVFTPHKATEVFSKITRLPWLIEIGIAPHAILADAPSDHRIGAYELTHVQPKYMLEVIFANGAPQSRK